jgi:hypothetical protein
VLIPRLFELAALVLRSAKHCAFSAILGLEPMTEGKNRIMLYGAGADRPGRL